MTRNNILTEETIINKRKAYINLFCVMDKECMNWKAEIRTLNTNMIGLCKVITGTENIAYEFFDRDGKLYNNPTILSFKDDIKKLELKTHTKVCELLKTIPLVMEISEDNNKSMIQYGTVEITDEEIEMVYDCINGVKI